MPPGNPSVVYLPLNFYRVVCEKCEFVFMYYLLKMSNVFHTLIIIDC